MCWSRLDDDPDQVTIQLWWWSRSSDLDVMIQTWWRSRSSDNPVVMMIQTRWSRSSDLDEMIQTWWWSKSSDDPAVMSQYSWWCKSRDKEKEDDLKTQRWRRLEEEDDLKTQKTRRWRRLEDKEDLNTKEDLKMTRWSSWCREEDQCWKLCWKNTFLVKRECWCICNFRMYSFMYLMSCNLMFILWCIYYVIESCFHALMFRSGGLIM